MVKMKVNMSVIIRNTNVFTLSMENLKVPTQCHHPLVEKMARRCPKTQRPPNYKFGDFDVERNQVLTTKLPPLKQSTPWQSTWLLNWGLASISNSPFYWFLSFFDNDGLTTVPNTINDFHLVPHTHLIFAFLAYRSSPTPVIFVYNEPLLDSEIWWLFINFW